MLTSPSCPSPSSARPLSLSSHVRIVHICEASAFLAMFVLPMIDGALALFVLFAGVGAILLRSASPVADTNSVAVDCVSINMPF